MVSLLIYDPTTPNAGPTRDITIKNECLILIINYKFSNGLFIFRIASLTTLPLRCSISSILALSVMVYSSGSNVPKAFLTRFVSFCSAFLNSLNRFVLGVVGGLPGFLLNGASLRGT